MAKKKKIKIIVTTLVIAVIALLVYAFKTTAEKEFAEGNYELSTSKYKEALNSYESAGKRWPFIKSSPEYQKNLKTTLVKIENAKNSPAVVIFLKPNATKEEIESLANEIRRVEGVKQVKVVSREDALKMYQNQYKNDPLITESATRDMFPVSIKVYTYEIPTEKEQANIISLLRNKVFVGSIITPSKN